MQCTVSGTTMSSCSLVTSGVPQGSILGPILFLIFINDLPLQNTESFTDLFADDTTMHTHGKNVTHVQAKLQASANTFQSWCKENKMTLNIDKTSVMTIGTNKRLSNIQDVVLYLNNTMLSNVKSQKLLGISIDNNLSWNSQINQMCKNISRKITLLKMLSK